MDSVIFRSASNVSVPQPVYTLRTGKRGRPRKHVDPRVLHEAFGKGRKISTAVLADILGIDRKTLRTQRQELDIDTGYSDISDSDLDNLVREYRQENPRACLCHWTPTCHAFPAYSTSACQCLYRSCRSLGTGNEETHWEGKKANKI